MILFASDVHLSASSPEITRRFLAFLDGPANDAEAVYLLGDLFDFWAGDDDLDDPFTGTVVTALRRLSDRGVAVYFLAGNRDFLIGPQFLTASGITPLRDPHILSVAGWQFVLTHGDQLCTEDHDYQHFRAEVRTPQWQEAFLAQPLAQRKRMIGELRARSEQKKRCCAKTHPDIMDVAPASVDDFLRAHGYASLIHGHTHRPDHHDHLVDGIHCERWVLGDWHSDAGDYLRLEGNTLHREAV
jgi:UDP-2,3-diacylglucosamine hydrolase